MLELWLFLYRYKAFRIGLISSKNEVYNNFWRNWHREGCKLKNEASLIFSDKNTEYCKFFKELSYTQVRYLIHFNPFAIMIIDESTFIFSYEKDFTCIQINSGAITNSLANFFDDLWKIAEK